MDHENENVLRLGHVYVSGTWLLNCKDLLLAISEHKIGIKLNK